MNFGSLFPFISVDGKISLWAVLGFALLLLAAMFLFNKVPFLRKVAG